MSVINMLRGGLANGGSTANVYTQNMYPRPDMLLGDMATQVGWENSKNSFHLNHRFNSCECWSSGAVKRAKDADTTTDQCSLEEGDEIPLVWIPDRWTIQAVTLTVNSGIKDLVVGIKRYSVEQGQLIIAGAVEEGVHLAGSDAGPLESAEVTQEDIDALGCNERIDMMRFCAPCSGGGCHYEEWLPEPELVGGCEPMGQYLSLVIETLPEDFDCSSCCLDIDVGAHVIVPRNAD